MKHVAVVCLIALGSGLTHEQATAQEPTGLAAAALANARFTWEQRVLPGFRVYFQANSHAARHQDSLLARLPGALAHARTLIRTTAPSGPIDIFLVDSWEDMAALIGGRATGFAHQAARAVFLVTNPTWRAFERHEIMHIVSWHAWGPPAAGTDWLQEGLAQAADGRCGAYTNEAVLRALTARRGWIPLDDILVAFRQQPDLRAYLQAAGFTRFLLDTVGSNALQLLWREGARPDTLVAGRTLALLEAEWRAGLAPDELPTPAELIDIEDIGCGVVSPPPDGNREDREPTPWAAS